MRKLFAAFVLVMLSSSCFAATIKFFTDYPNAVPVGSDFFVFQRNQSYINATVSQVKSDWFNNPSFTGNGAISGAFGVGGFFVANGIMYGNGAGLTNVLTLTTNVNFQFITNNIEYTTNLFVTTNFVNTSFTTNLFVDNSITTNLFVTQEFVTNLVAGTITNNTFVTTNVFVDNSVVINSNLTVQTITNNTFITTNVTINQPGGLTNLNAVPNTVAYWDINGSLGGVPNGSGVLTNNGSGGVGYSQSLSLTEIDAANFYPTNLFTGLTNYTVLGTDANGLLTLGSSTLTNITITNAFIQLLTNNTFVNTNVSIFTSTSYVNNLYATNTYFQTNFTTNLFFVSGKGNTLIITNVSIEASLTNKGVAANSAVITTAAQVETNAVNAIGVFTNSASGPPSFGLAANNMLVNSSITIAGTANQVGVSGGGPVSLGGTATLSLPSPTIFPGSIAATTITNSAATASTVATYDANLKLISLANAYGILTNSGSVANWSSAYPQGDGAAVTNLTYRYVTNNTGSTTLNWGTAYRTNIAADVTLSLQSVSAAPNAQFYETIVYWVTNSSASNFKTTWPSGVIGPVGSGTPSVLYCTNKTLTRILVEHYGPSDITVSKTDFGN